MRGWRHPARCAALVAALALLTPALALASSAGDQQYIDPLAGNTTSTAAPPPHTTPAPAASPAPSAPATSTPAPARSASAATPSVPSSTTTPPPTTTTTAAADAQPTLPYTGLNLGLCAAVGVGLVGAGILLRRLARAA